jgi:hypothetical protein
VARYVAFSPAWLRLREPPPEPLSEADLSLIWEGQRFPPEALHTVDGRAVEVVTPGRRGGAAGPDFVDAVVRLDGVERSGDVELHVRASAFRGHGHQADPAYSRLALHVVYRADDGAETALCGGGQAPVAAFAPWLERRGAELQSWLAAPSMWQEPCRGAAGRLGEAAVRDALVEAGRARFKSKTARMAEAVGRLGAEEALWRALLDTLGVGGDRAGFRRLAEAFPASLAASVEDLEGALAYVAGLGEAPAEARGLPEPLKPKLKANGRPANQPPRRLAGLAALWRRAAEESRKQRAENRPAGRHGATGAEDWGARGPSGNRASVVARGGGRRAGAGRGGPLVGMALESVRSGDVKRALAAWTVTAGGGPALIGDERARELLVNAVLPLTASRGLKDEAATLLQALTAAPAYGKTGFLESNLRPARGRAARTALEQQGLLGLIERWCSRGGCGRCPLS